jgi:1-acyl-sn-glycerol-3-phosphate acyltransferase
MLSRLFDPLAVNYEPISAAILRRYRPAVQAMRSYHAHNVSGLDRVTPGVGTLLAINHSFATYDALLLCSAIVDATGVVPCALGDDLIFRTPGVRRFATRCGVVPASHENGMQLLAKGRMVVVAPGGMREALRPSDERYNIRWDRRKGFVRLALRAGSPIQLAACPNADRLYHVYENTLTKLAYRQLRVPVPLLRGWGPTWIPRPVQLTHIIDSPMHPDPIDEPHFEQQVDDWHQTIRHRMSELMTQAQS